MSEIKFAKTGVKRSCCLFNPLLKEIFDTYVQSSLRLELIFIHRHIVLLVRCSQHENVSMAAGVYPTSCFSTDTIGIDRGAIVMMIRHEKILEPVRLRPRPAYRFSTDTPVIPAPNKTAHSKNGKPRVSPPLLKTVLNKVDHNGPETIKAIVLTSPRRT